MNEATVGTVAEAAVMMNMAEEFNGEEEKQEVAPQLNSERIQKLLAEIVDLDTEKKSKNKRVDEINERLAVLKEQCRDLFIELGVDSLKAHGRTVYLAKQLWVGSADDVDKVAVVDELKVLGLSGHISFNTQSLSGYTRELAKDHEEFCNDRGEITASPEEILTILPGKLKNLLKVTEKIDIKIRK